MKPKLPSITLVVLLGALILIGFVFWFAISFSPGGNRGGYSDAPTVNVNRQQKAGPDSTHVVKLAGDLEIRQVFGPGIDIVYRLVDVSGKEPKLLDEIFSLRGDDGYIQPGISYDPINDWFVFSSTDSDSNDYLQQTTYVRVEANRFHELISFPADQSFTDTESSPVSLKSMQVNVVEASGEQLVLTAVCNTGILSADSIFEKHNTFKDRAVFVYDQVSRKFVFSRSENARFRLVWEEKEYYPE
jgi:hypothetical protein